MNNDCGIVMMTPRQVASRLNVSIRTLWRLVYHDKFPQPVRYNRKLVRWTSKTVNEWLENQCSRSEG